MIKHHFPFRLFGVLVTLLCLCFLGRQLWLHGREIIQRCHEDNLLVIIITSGAAYGLICSLPAFAWHYLLSGIDMSVPLNFVTSYRIYSRAQIAKYLPGNIFHFIGRQQLGSTAGLRHTPVFIASMFEVILIVTSALYVAAIGMCISGNIREQQVAFGLAAVLITAFMIIIVILLSKLSGWFPSIEQYLEPLSSHGLKAFLKATLPPFGLYVALFLMFGLLLWLIAFTFFGGKPSFNTFGAFVSIYSVAWVTGFITPGAPAGMGIRETVLSAGLSPFVGIPDALFLTLIYRVVSTVGDFLFFLTSFLCPKK